MATRPEGDAGVPARVLVTLLGPFSVSLGSTSAGPWPRPTAKRLCELVLIAPGRFITKERAGEALFPRLSPDRANRAVAKSLSMARATLAQLGRAGRDLLQADRQALWAVQDLLDVDLDGHRGALERALSMRSGEARDEALREALLNDRPLLAHEPSAEWALRAREGLDDIRAEARLALARDRAHGFGCSAPENVVQAWEACLRADPACEEAATALVCLYGAQGRPSLLEATYRDCCQALDELGLRPSASLQAAYSESRPTAPTAQPGPGTGGIVTDLDELRVVSVVCAELLAPLNAGLGPEELKDAVSSALAVLIGHVEVLGGTVTSVSSSRLEAVFGAPVSHDDDPERALRAAYRMQASINGGAATGLGIGVETGPTVVGPVGDGARYGMVGETVATAALLASAAKAGSVLVGPVTQVSAEAHFEWGPSRELARELDRRGKYKPILATPLVRPKARPALVAKRHRAWAAPLVGREVEISVLDTALRRAVSGDGGVVVVAADPGLGKTRLVSECRQRFMGWVGAGSGRLPLWMEGRAASYTSWVPYGLYQQLFLSWMGITVEDGPSVARAALGRAMRAVFKQESELLPLLARLVGAESPQDTRALAHLSPEGAQRATFGAVRAVMARLVARGPTVLAVEDLHWADPTSLRLTEELAVLTANSPLLLLATRRPEPDPGVSALEAAIAARADIPFCRLELSPLSTKAEEALVLSLLGDDAPLAVIDVARAKAEGNPFFLEERVSSLLETRALVKDDRGWHLELDGPAPLPPALDRLIRARLDRLEPRAREVAITASVLGPEFSVDELQGMTESSDELGGLVKELCSAGVLEAVPKNARTYYRFRHALIQEATYNGLVKSHRRRLHAKAAWALEESAAENVLEVAGALGRHYAAAGEEERARRYLEMAGDKAASVFASQEAVSCYRSALRLSEPGATEGRPMGKEALALAGKLADVLNKLGTTASNREARELLLQAISSDCTGDSLLAARLHWLKGRVESSSGDPHSALAALATAEDLLGDDPEDKDQGTADLWLDIQLARSQAYLQCNDPDQGLPLLAAVRPTVDARGGDRKLLFFVQLGAHLLLQRRWRIDDEILSLHRAAVTAAEETSDELGIVRHLSELGELLALAGRIDEAEPALAKGLTMSERTGDSHNQARILCAQTITALRQHKADLAASLLPKALAASEAVACPEHAPFASACQPWLALLRGDEDAVEALAEHAIGRLKATEWTRHFSWVCLWPLIAVRVKRGDTAQAIAAAGDLLATPVMRMPDDVQAALETSMQTWDKGENERAHDGLVKAVALAYENRFL